MPEWHLITAEYPPQPGGVSDYTHLVASGLAARGDMVHVWCPPANGAQPDTNGVFVHRCLGRITTKDLRQVGQMLNRWPSPRRLLVQWVPHAYGYRSMNLPFCLWLWQRRFFQGDAIELMVHEPFLGFGGGPWKHNIPAAVHRLMTIILLNAAQRVWIAIPAWEARLQPYALGRRMRFQWLPVPSNVPVVDDPAGVSEVKGRYLPRGGFLLGHFGTYGPPIAELLQALLPALLEGHANRTILLMGRGSERFHEAIVSSRSDLSTRLHATGPLAARDVSRHVSACDLMIQPYPDGVTSRRGTTMVALAHAKPVVTTRGILTEPLWVNSRAVATAAANDIDEFVEVVGRLLADRTERRRLGTAARKLYEERFDIQHVIRVLQADSARVSHAAESL